MVNGVVVKSVEFIINVVQMNCYISKIGLIWDRVVLKGGKGFGVTVNSFYF